MTGSYTDYLANQAGKAKLPSTVVKLGDRAKRVAWFKSRFASARGSFLCLGARFGEEVEALWSLGCSAQGVDIECYRPWVEAGDMNGDIPGCDFVYTNAFDHCWEPRSFLANIRRAASGLMLHLSNGVAGSYETVEWDRIQDVTDMLRECGFHVDTVEKIKPFHGLCYEVFAS